MIAPNFKTPIKTTSNVGSCIMKLFISRDQAHVFHLQTSAFAKHKALNEYYDGIISLIDGIAEQYQGKYGIIKGYKCDCEIVEGDQLILPYFTKLRDYVTEVRYKEFKKEDSELQNSIDEIVSLLNSTIYKLKFLN